ncbi:MAG: DUF3880 domain-containing protein [Desulfonauticus sp.]|nr:DUF3880 domain-containing protein [Desulfonauticus sp.]
MHKDILGSYPEQFLKRVEQKITNYPDRLPVFLGYAPELVTYFKQIDRPVAFVLPSVEKNNLSCAKNCLIIVEKDLSFVLKQLTKWQAENKGKKFLIFSLPYFWKRYKDFYQSLYSSLQLSQKFNFWEKAKYKKFASEPKILLITSKYFLMGEIISACQRLNYQYYLLQLPNQEIGTEEFIQGLLKAVVEFKPDFIFTINHLGVDREGILIDLLERLELPLVSWFVDNPHLILYLYNKVKSNLTFIFTWDADNIELLKKRGFNNVYYLPLAADTYRFNPKNNKLIDYRLKEDISFIGNSMVYKVLERKQKLAFFPDLLTDIDKIALIFKESSFLTVSDCLKEKFPHVYVKWQNLPDIEYKLSFEALITWLATLYYRLECVKEILPFNPKIVGDKGWFEILPPKGWRYGAELNYYKDLPFFYGKNKINFNATSAQMKGAVNQRVFDVPASGNFLITDYRSQMENLFVLNKEIVFYRHKDEIPELVDFYLKHPTLRDKIIQRALERILQEHTYEHRVKFIYQTMKRAYQM